MPDEKIRIIHNGIDPERFRPSEEGARVREELGLSNDAFLAILPGRLSPEKGQTELVRAVALLRARTGRHRGARGRRRFSDDAGGGSHRAALEALRAELGLGVRVRFVPHRRDVPAVMHAADVVVIPSHWEPFGLVVVEALACGRPVVAARAGAIPELVDDGVSGVLVPVRDPTALADAIERLWREPELRRRLGQRAREEVRARFTERRMADELGRLYEDVVAGAQIGRAR